tara:strand:+ start:110 stop:559 length:450 start_codon:yes stop_codon:yes gene_type:complete
MAISRGAGTEIIRSAQFEDIINTDVTLIFGEQHHIYTVLSIIIHCTDGNGDGELKIKGWDAKGGGTGSYQILTKIDALPTNSTFVWNDKFSFNGAEPDGSVVSGIMGNATEQNGIADQGSTNYQELIYVTSAAGTKHDVAITYIDQNNA